MQRRALPTILATAFGLIALAGPSGAGSAPAPHADPPQAKPQAQAKPQVGMASYFGAGTAGKTAADGHKAKPLSTLTAASRSLPLGTKAKVTNLSTGKSVRVKVTDRGPYAKRRILDVSAKAARRLGMTRKGVAPVKVQPLAAPGARRTEVAAQ